MKRLRLSKIFLALVILYPALVFGSVAKNCTNIFRFAPSAIDIAPSNKNNDILEVDYNDGGIKSKQMITGENYFSAEVIAQGLDVSLADIPSSPHGPKPSYDGQIDHLLVAMSYTRILPILIDKGSAVKALDIWYNQPAIPSGDPIGNNMKAFNTLYSEHLIGASALHMPLRDESVKNVWSYRLVSAQTRTFQKQFLSEVLRVLEVGGEARIYGFDKADNNTNIRFLKKYGNSIEFSFIKKPLHWTHQSSLQPNFADGMKLTPTDQQQMSTTHEINIPDGYLLVIKKNTSISSPNKALPIIPLYQVSNHNLNKVKSEIIAIADRLHSSGMARGEESIFPIASATFDSLLAKDRETGLSQVAFGSNGQVQGFSLAYFNRERGSVFLEKFGVSTDAQGKGLGAKLLHSLAVAASHQNIESVELMVLKGNAKAIAIYEHLGFKNITPAHALSDSRYNAYLFSVAVPTLLNTTLPQSTWTQRMYNNLGTFMTHLQTKQNH